MPVSWYTECHAALPPITQAHLTRYVTQDFISGPDTATVGFKLARVGAYVVAYGGVEPVQGEGEGEGVIHLPSAGLWVYRIDSQEWKDSGRHIANAPAPRYIVSLTASPNLYMQQTVQATLYDTVNQEQNDGDPLPIECVDGCLPVTSMLNPNTALVVGGRDAVVVSIDKKLLE
ncbi:hypothetical protein KIPB_006346 [Kipferlia bialata]|uniref:Uncharacterized protein n=1 Tax=Kipferlia bialata TaxID=797122 RepID=A0A9K3CYP6_9EUKA|nr:hypothetical protein KIPB_006346 [Kipferlia bialata]|eukprot:g6346.t1